MNGSTVVIYLREALADAEAALTQAERREAEPLRGRARRAELRPDRIVQHGVGAGARPVAVHTRTCPMAAPSQARTTAETREEAARLITAGVETCSMCCPDRPLGLLD